MPRALTHEPEERMTREDYRAWASQQPSHRFERIEGVVVAMAPERAAHNRRKGSARDALRAAVQRAGLPCEVFADGMTIEVGDSDYEPDAVVRCGGDRLPDDAMAVPDPLVIVEVLSPNTSGVDRGLKIVRRQRAVEPVERRDLVVAGAEGDRGRGAVAGRRDVEGETAERRPPLAHARRRHRYQSLRVWRDRAGSTGHRRAIRGFLRRLKLRRCAASGFVASRGRHRQPRSTGSSRIDQDACNAIRRGPARPHLVHQKRPP